MRTSETLLLDLIRQSPELRIPVNQRRYAWTRRHCRQLWDDILDAGARQDVREHFLGPVMYVAVVDPLNAHWASYLVYGSQQRLTTITDGANRQGHAAIAILAVTVVEPPPARCSGSVAGRNGGLCLRRFGLALAAGGVKRPFMHWRAVSAPDVKLGPNYYVGSSQ